MIKRIWRGWTSPEDAGRYERLLRREVLAGIAARHIPGHRGIELLRRVGTTEVEFMTSMSFDSFDSVRAFVGSDYTRAYVPAPAREILRRFDDHARHYEVRPTHSGD